ncbi:MAG: Gfo/Idh/MocA family protein [Bryobacteraceae bacterium]
MIVAAHVLGRGASAAPSDRVTVGFIGAGGRALSWRQPKLMVETAGMPNARIIAVAEADKRRLDEGKVFVDTIYGNADCAAYSDFRKMLDRKDIDAVFVATPHHWHAVMTIMACQAGKDVYCEKPLSLTIREAVRMAEAAAQHSRIVQGGTQARSSPTVRFAMDQIRKGRIGDVKTVQVGCWGQARFMDVTPEPVPDYLDWEMYVGPAKMCPYSSKVRWGARREFSGGTITDWGHHFFDVAQWGLGVDESGPVEVFPAGRDHEFVTLRYSNGAQVQLHAKDGKALSTGTTFLGTQGTIYAHAWEDYVEFEPKELGFEYLKENGLKIPENLPPSQKVLAVQIDGTVPPKERDDFSDNGTALHIANFLDCVRTRRKPNADVQLSRRSVTLAHLVNIALWTNRPLKWDPQKFQFPGDDEANSHVHIEPRAPWKL